MSATCRATRPTCPPSTRARRGPASASTSTTTSPPLYVVSPDRTKQVTKLKALLKDSDELLLATDEDREGEAIAWHLVETLKPKVPIRRMVFHEITRSAIQQAVANPREIDQSLVDAQEARRILDRLYGYEVSPVLWKKVMPHAASRPAGCSRSPPASWSSASASGCASAPPSTGTSGPSSRSRPTRSSDGPRTFAATLVSLDGDRIATGKDFDPATGQVRRGRRRGPPRRRRRPRAGGPAGGPAVRGHPGRGEAVPPPPVRAVHHLDPAAGGRHASCGYSSAQTMRTAQRLYENGYITYMRTDSVNLAETAIAAARTQIAELFGDRFVPPQPRQYTGKVKNAQEAHEAIRPAGDVFRTPGEVANELSTEEFKLYELIWRRTIASQMTDAVGSSVSVRIRAVSTAERGVRLRRDRQDDHRSRASSRPTWSPPTTPTPRPTTPSTGCPTWPRASR